MDANVYFVEKYTESQARRGTGRRRESDLARVASPASIRRARRRRIGLIWIGHKLRRRDRVRRHARLPLPSPS